MCFSFNAAAFVVYLGAWEETPPTPRRNDNVITKGSDRTVAAGISGTVQPVQLSLVQFSQSSSQLSTHFAAFKLWEQTPPHWEIQFWKEAAANDSHVASQRSQVLQQLGPKQQTQQQQQRRRRRRFESSSKLYNYDAQLQVHTVGARRCPSSIIFNGQHYQLHPTPLHRALYS